MDQEFKLFLRKLTSSVIFGTYFGFAMSIYFRKRFVSCTALSIGTLMGYQYCETNKRFGMIGHIAADPQYKPPEKQGKYLTDEQILSKLTDLNGH
ncbi:UNKNOWN [Stylonychia lemnae]|uniref:Uncharacterized protein n=1 Tax=Stylonychia lemnae TaxID=5949 RepID=A0A078AA26_STYLE|nr:UNKNOWN [Stylonychia lemnae]|eukprot:CDW78407.1 UNKNOWN [Stylonychia lemnae]